MKANAPKVNNLLDYCLANTPKVNNLSRPLPENPAGRDLGEVEEDVHLPRDVERLILRLLQHREKSKNCKHAKSQRFILRLLQHQPSEWLHTPNNRYSSQFKNNYFTKVFSGSEAGSYLRLIDCCITQL